MDRPDILLDVSRLVWRVSTGRLPTGIDRVALAYVDHYRDHARAVVQRGGLRHIWSADRSRELFDLLLGGGESFRTRFGRALARSLAGGADGSVAGAFYLNVGHTGLDASGLPLWIARRQVRPIYMVHDLIPLTHPEYCRPGEDVRHARRMKTVVDTAAGVIGNSAATLDIFAGFAEACGTALPPTIAAWLGATSLPPEAVEPIETRPYFVTLGTIEGRKNHLMLLNVWADLVARYGTDAPRLLIIGQRGWECAQTTAMLDRCTALAGHVRELPGCGDIELARHLRGARALLFPSFTEGFGMPLVEALGHGTPVIASDLAVFRELAGAIPEYLSPIDGAGWADMIDAYAERGSTKRAAQVRRMWGYTMPNWTEHFARVDGWLAELERSREFRLGVAQYPTRPHLAPATG